MKKTLFFLTASLFYCAVVLGQPVNGIIDQDTSGILVVKVWGTHSERGYALGYLTGPKITDMIVNYLKPSFGIYYNAARNIVIQGVDLSIPQAYQDEAQAVVEGMTAAGTNTAGLDKTDVLLGNCMLDVSNLLGKNLGLECSTLMSWGDATAGTGLDGKSVATRHMDWTYSATLINNNIITVHFPAEADESPWMLIGYAGMISTLSGVNQDFSAFQQVMGDYTSMGLHNKQYIPIWMAMRRALEAGDYNGDGLRNVQDLRSSLMECSNGVASGYIITSLARNAVIDSTVAMVAELTPTPPTHTCRYNDYEDKIPGDNLYASNYQIKRNDLRNYDSRYNSVVTAIGDGTSISTDTSWAIMRDHSHQSNNMQFMEYSPETDLFRLSIWRNSQPAYLNDPVDFSLAELFADPSVGIDNRTGQPSLIISPNPVVTHLRVAGIPAGEYRYEVFDCSGRSLRAGIVANPGEFVEAGSLPPGICFIRLTGRDGVYLGRFMKR